MTDDVRNLIRFVVDGDIRNAQTQCRIMLEKNVPEKDARFKEAELKKLNLLKPELIQLPANLESLLIAEDATNFPRTLQISRKAGSCSARRKKQSSTSSWPPEKQL